MLSAFFYFPLLVRNISNTQKSIENSITNIVTNHQDLINADILPCLLQIFYGEVVEQNALDKVAKDFSKPIPLPPQGKSSILKLMCVLFSVILYAIR